MKVVVLAGGMGTRLAEETEVRPKPMIEIGGRPILWHILKHYAHFGFREFLIALGYRSESIKRFFCDYHELNGDLTVALGSGQVERHVKAADDWIVHLKDTGLETSTGGRVKRLEPMLSGGTFMLTYGDGVADVDLRELLAFHRRQGRLPRSRPCGRRRDSADWCSTAIWSSSSPKSRKSAKAGSTAASWCSNPRSSSTSTAIERASRIDALERLASERQLAAFRHERFWQCMDTLRDKRLLETLWQQGRAPWNMWT